VNYYEHHLGDYLRDTAHLSMLEDGAYRRLLDAYYIKEAPLPLELRDVYRLTRAASKQDRQAIETVLREFFQQTPEGWQHPRCEREIAEYRETIPDREARRENDRERQRRSRERRKALFELLRSHDIVPPFDTKTSELEAMASRVTQTGKSRGVTQPVTRDNTATQTPDTRHHSSDADASGAGAPPDTADVIFGLGVPLLTAANVSDRNARSMLGMFRKQHGDAAVIDALQRCASEKPMQPVPWLQAALKAKPPGSKPARTSATERQIATMDALTGRSRNDGPTEPADVIDVTARAVG
jgi:uncharacterized protein YdaU (DUF1376 family)